MMFTPVFKGCENLTIEENKECFQNKMKRFVKRKFDTDKGLAPGVYRVFSEFVINKEGVIEKN